MARLDGIRYVPEKLPHQATWWHMTAMARRGLAAYLMVTAGISADESRRLGKKFRTQQTVGGNVRS
jgi:hypothetical protein